MRAIVARRSDIPTEPSPSGAERHPSRLPSPVRSSPSCGARGPGRPTAWTARAAAACVLAGALALAGGAAAHADGARLLTALTAEAGPAGVSLVWTVDETRADHIAGFTCVYRTPGHLKTGVSGAVPCASDAAAADARSRAVAGLPEYGDYDFELVAVEKAGGPAIPWPLRALRVRVAVTEALAGAPGPGRAATGTGPLVESCGPGDGSTASPAAAGDTEAPRSWRLAEIVSAGHLTHYPGRGWTAGGDAGAAPDWPRMPRLTDPTADAGLDPERVRRALAGAGAEAAEAAQRMVADARFDAVLARAGAGTKALLRPGRDGGRELRLHTAYPFGADYLFEARHAVPGWADAAHAAAWPGLWNRVDCPPEHWPDGTHDVALALSDAAGGGRRLAHSGYGWWAVAPVGMYPERIVAAKAGLSFGEPAPESSALPTATGSAWRGRLSGHLFRDRRRFAVAGDLTLTLEGTGAAARLAGRIDNVVLASLDHASLQPEAVPPVPWRAFALDADTARDGAWSGAVRLDEDPRTGDEGMPAADAFLGDWRAAAYGPDAGEITGRLRLWTPLAEGADPRAAWPGQAVLVAGFGGVRTP